jgi:hypothetical protein
MLKRRKNEAKKVIGQRFNTFSREYQSMQPELVEGPLGKRAAFANVFLPRLTCFFTVTVHLILLAPASAKVCRA